MINLIPNEEKKKMSKDFYFRLVTLIFIMFSISLLIASILIVPSYFLSSVDKTSIDTKVQLQENEAVSLSEQDTMATINDLKSKLGSVENFKKNQYLFSQKIINEVVLKKISSLRITEIHYQNDPKTGRKISISGIALNRDVLLSFKRALEDDVAFSKVDLPISNFVKGSNIKFYLNLIPK